MLSSNDNGIDKIYNIKQIQRIYEIMRKKQKNAKETYT